MALQDTVNAIGDVTITIMDENLNVQETRLHKNMIVTVGKSYIASRMVGTAKAVMSHMAIGIGVNTPELSNTTLVNESVRVALASLTASSNVVTASATFPTGTEILITEAGIFNASGANAGDMLCRSVFPAVQKLTSQVIGISWAITIK